MTTVAPQPNTTTPKTSSRFTNHHPFNHPNPSPVHFNGLPPISPEFIPGRVTNEANNTIAIAAHTKSLLFTPHRIKLGVGTIAISITPGCFKVRLVETARSTIMNGVFCSSLVACPTASLKGTVSWLEAASAKRLKGIIDSFLSFYCSFARQSAKMRSLTSVSS
ncbi:MAG: hypothetical protein ACAF41_22180 [Leptolyngbya sp. BL-A-14]